ncbi:MAG TPA: ATP-dependent zinc protease [Pseudomonas xinjiangensis]|uniref:ATP-dependent zinc protease n=2 Tax=root TaxID=1 RepID=A0A7V1BLQ1_9GAMM|nr:ATP-dependent zinc protease [Halopseudomonas xinjiangensis]HEC47063.1 ATP-dependent zinc protease [Halopseudomonas xinjiangensis]
MQLKMLALFSSLVLVPVGAVADDLTLYGVSEKAKLPELNVEVPAKLDTGAVTASLSAVNIELFQRDETDWVRFDLALEDEPYGETLELPVVRTSKIKRRADDVPDGQKKAYTSRPVIEMEVCLGDERHTIEVNLTDRTAFSYPLLIGSTALQQFDAAVDPSLKYSAGTPACA